MSIIDPGSVFIIGAGASAPFGLPLGGQLVDDIANRLEREIDTIKTVTSDYGRKGIVPTYARFRNYMEEHPDQVLLLTALYEDFKLQEIEFANRNAQFDKFITSVPALQNRLKNQASETIDDFIVENPSLAKPCKIAIAAMLFDAMYDYDQSTPFFTLRNFSARQINPKDKKENAVRNWVHLLINIVRQGIRTSSFENRKINIISFNYDFLLEHILEERFLNSELRATEGKTYKDYFNILHPHGFFNPLNEKRIEYRPDMIIEWANEIFVVNEETTPDSLLEVREEVKNIILNSEKIYVAGFAFAKPNCQLMGLDQRLVDENSSMPRLDVDVHYCNFDGRIGLENNLKSLHPIERDDFEQKRIHKATPNTVGKKPGEYLEIHEWISLGHIGDASA